MSTLCLLRTLGGVVPCSPQKLCEPFCKNHKGAHTHGGLWAQSLHKLVPPSSLRFLLGRVNPGGKPRAPKPGRGNERKRAPVSPRVPRNFWGTGAKIAREISPRSQEPRSGPRYGYPGDPPSPGLIRGSPLGRLVPGWTLKGSGGSEGHPEGPCPVPVPRLLKCHPNMAETT